MKTLSVKQPWSFLICSGIKDVENRMWKLPEKYKGERVLIHASAKLKSDLGSLLTYEQRLYIADHSSEEIKRMRTDDFNFSAIIGSVRFVDCVINHPSIWAEKNHEYPELWKNPKMYESAIGKKLVYNWVVDDAVLFTKPILNVKGKLNFWESFYEPIICPECGQIQCAKVENTIPFATYIHDCEKCGYTIMESEWDKIK